MTAYLRLIQKEFRGNIDTLIDDFNDRKDKDSFRPTGTVVYVGKQGSGKTASAVYHVLFKLHKRYPKAIIVSNLAFTGMDGLGFGDSTELAAILRHINTEKQYISFNDIDQLALALTEINNGKYGVIYLIDEIHTYFNSKDSKNIPMYVFNEISQQRKQRKAIIGTSQLFMRAAIALREQCMYVIACNTYMGVLTRQKAYEGDDIEDFYSSKAMRAGKAISAKRTGWFVQTRELRESYDTYQKVSSGLDVLDMQQSISLTIMGSRNPKSGRNFGRL